MCDHCVRPPGRCSPASRSSPLAEAKAHQEAKPAQGRPPSSCSAPTLCLQPSCTGSLRGVLSVVGLLVITSRIKAQGAEAEVD